MPATCPWCAAPRADGPACPSCGANYAKAEAIKTRGRAAVEPAPPPVPVATVSPFSEPDPRDADEVLRATSEEELPTLDDPAFELKLCLAAIPCALLAALAWHAFGLGHALQRIFLSMPVHELGHAVMAWFCGFAAIPTVWKTITPETRGPIFPLLMLALIGYGIYRAHEAGRRDLMAVLGGLVLLQAIGTLGLSATTARQLIIFSGDGMGMVLAVLLMGSFFFGRDTQLYKGSLRWGFVFIGAAAFIDIYAVWWNARSDLDAIPFGEQNGGPTDPSFLVDEYGWGVKAMVRRFNLLGMACLFATAVVYAWGCWQAWQQPQA